MKVIGLVGYPRTGKDAIAEKLVEDHGFVRLAFGDSVKRLLLAIDPSYNNNLDVLEKRKASSTYETREKIQNLGQVLRNFREDFWVDSLREEFMELPPDVSVIITDIRYQNEFDFVNNAGGEVVAIDRPGFGPVNGHESEVNTAVLVKKAARTIINSGTIQQAADALLSL
tara:strand:+ start:33280 stop:33789 length:510 start_codon:yes stop_codon:yes gene_type:complete